MSEEEQKPRFARVLKEFYALTGSSASSGVAKALVYINIFILAARPQDVIRVLGASKLPLIGSIIAIPITLVGLHKLFKVTQMKCMMAILCIGGAMVPLAHNNFLAYHTFRDLLMQFIAYFFPMFLILTSGKDIKKLIDIFIVMGCYFSLWGLTHGGVGPGGFLGDENDLGLAMVAMLGFPLLALEEAKGTRRLFYISSVLIILAGTVATASRGTFVGVVMLAFFGFLQSTKKFKIVGVGIFVFICGLPFVPSEYWEDIKTIGDTNEGTSSARIEMWTIASHVWLHPPHFLAGAGLNNVPILIGDFEPEINQTSRGKSRAGRAVHSSLFQLLPDLGLLGFLSFATLVWTSFFGNRKLIQACLQKSRLLVETKRRLNSYARKSFETGDFEKEDLVPAPIINLGEEEAGINIRQAQALLSEVQIKLGETRTLLLGATASLMGTLGAGFFVSALYYPSFWMIFTVCTMVQLYTRRLFGNIERLADSFELSASQVSRF